MTEQEPGSSLVPSSLNVSRWMSAHDISTQADLRERLGELAGRVDAPHRLGTRRGTPGANIAGRGRSANAAPCGDGAQPGRRRGPRSGVSDPAAAAADSRMRA
jgi:hypothetical protein